MSSKQRWKHGELTEKIIGLFYDVYNGWGMVFWKKSTKTR